MRAANEAYKFGRSYFPNIEKVICITYLGVFGLSRKAETLHPWPQKPASEHVGSRCCPSIDLRMPVEFPVAVELTFQFLDV